MIEYQEYTNSYLLACEKCRRNDAVATARTLDQAKQIASTVFKWAVDTPVGVLCPSCTVRWREGIFGREEMEAAAHNRPSTSVSNAS